MIMSVILLIAGTIMAAMLIIFLIIGQKYNYMLEPLDDGDFPLKSLYVAGLAMQDVSIFRYSGKIEDYLKDKTKLVYSRKYSEFYSRIAWAQALSMGLLCGSVCFLLAGMLAEMAGFMALLGIVMIVLPGYYFISSIGTKVQQRQGACEAEFPNAISKLALIVNSGVILHEAWEIVAYGNTGELYDLMQKSCEEMRNGKADIDAIYEFGISTNSDEIKKFASALIQSIERGGGALPIFLSNQSKELWAHRRQVMLQKGEKAAGALLMPIAMMFLGVMLIVIAAAMQSFSM